VECFREKKYTKIVRKFWNKLKLLTKRNKNLFINCVDFQLIELLFNEKLKLYIWIIHTRFWQLMILQPIFYY